MGWEAILTVILLVMAIVAMARNLVQPEAAMLGVLALLMVGGVYSDNLPGPKDAIAGFGNPGPITVGVLFVVAAALTRTGATAWITGAILGRPRSALGAQSRLIFPVAAMSAFLNNTPIVAMLVPVVGDWGRKINIPPARLLMPLSFAAILGGTCTLIGTSTNLVVNGLLIDDPTVREMGIFEIGAIGLPITIAGLVYILVANRFLLPARKPALDANDDPRQYTVEMIVDRDGPIVGQTIEKAALRSLPGLYLMEINREGDVLPAVGPEVVLKADDRLVFVGQIESVIDLRKMRGLSVATNQVFKLNAPSAKRSLFEAVVSNSCSLIGKSIRQGRFRSVYQAAVIAVARNGQRIQGKIGDIVLQPGDTLLLEAHDDFDHRHRSNRDFFLVSSVSGSAPIQHERAPLALAILAAMVVVVAVGWMPMLTAAMFAAGLLWVTRCINTGQARNAIDLQVILIIGAALGIGSAVQRTGLADFVAHELLLIVGQSPMLTLIAIYVLTNLFTELMTNNAAAVLIYPIAKATAIELGADPLPMIVTIMVAASASFCTPIGYQTNLMVMGPGGYRFGDYLRFGLPLNLLVMTITVICVPMIWSLHP